MDIQEEDFNSPQQNKPLSLRKPKQTKQTSSKNAKISSNDILNGEIILENEQIEFIHKKRYRLINNTELINNNIESNKKYKDYEEEQLYNKIIEIYNQLQVETSKEIKEGEYDSEYHDKREAIVLELLKNVNLFNDIRKLSTKTNNENIYCTILDIFNDFCYYNNQFMIDSHEYLIDIIDNAFGFDNKNKAISLAIKFCYSVIDFGFFEEKREKFIQYFMGLALDDKKNNIINCVQGAKVYLYYIIYLIFKDSWENINLDQDIFQKFIVRVLSEININSYELIEVLILLINTMCDNILYPKIFKKQPINYEIAKEIIKYMFQLISVILNNILPNEREKIVKVENINYIIRQTFNVILKIISGVNLIKENDINLQQMLVPQKEKQMLFDFIMLFSGLNLDEKNFLWLADIMAKFAEISYYSDIYLKEETMTIIFGKFMLKEKYISDVFQFLRSLLEVEPLFTFYSKCDKFYEALNSLNIDKSQLYTCVHFLFMIQNLLESGEKYGNIDDIYNRLCTIHTKEKMEQIFYKYGNDDIIHKKYNAIMPKLEELEKKIDID